MEPLQPSSNILETLSNATEASLVQLCLATQVREIAPLILVHPCSTVPESAVTHVSLNNSNRGVR